MLIDNIKTKKEAVLISNDSKYLSTLLPRKKHYQNFSLKKYIVML